MPRPWLVLVLCVLWAPTQTRITRSDPFTCATTDSVAAAQAAVPDTFHVHRPGFGQDLSHRDLEFFWHARPTWDSVLTPQVIATLNNFGATLCDITGLNPFGIDVGAFHLVYEYFRREPVPYGTSPGDTTAATAIVIGKGAGAAEYPTMDRAHLDLYLIDSSIPGVAPGRYASAFVSPLEDVSTGHPALSDSALGLNSIHIRGPAAAQRHDLDGTGWAAPGRVRAVGALHELQHSLPGGSELDPYTELFSAGAEAIAGHQDPVLDPAEFEVPYTWPLTAHVNTLFMVPPAEPGVGRNAGDNYQGRTAFAAYLAYNFRGADTAATLPAIDDDLLHRWSRQPKDQHTLAGLRNLLADDSCATCATRPYFQGLDNASRLGLLIHNWRVANYVNNSTLADGQYGYPPQFGFSPAVNLKAWQSFIGGTSDDNVSIPPEVVLTSAHRQSEVSLAGERSWVGAPYPMMLQPLGSEYWVVRADPSAWTAGQDLVVRVTPESFYRFLDRKALRVGDQTICTTSIKSDGRLACSVIGYAPPDNQVSAGQLWQHPEWAVTALPPKWVDVDSMAGPLEFVLPGFGSTVKAAVVVLSLADGPAQKNYAMSIGNGYVEALPYRLSLALRRGPYQAINPWPQAAGALASDDEVVWSPGGDSLLFTRTSAGVPKLYWKLLAGSAILPMLPGSPADERQTCPAWSPRGDYVAFTKQAGAGAQKEVWVYNQRLGTDLRRLVTRSGAELCAEFQPNGQRLAYVWQWTTGDSIAEIGRIRLDGTSDVVLYRREGSTTPSSLRWSSDGQWIYFLANDSLYAVRADGPTQGQVVAHPELAAGSTFSFDLAPSTGPVLLEQVVNPSSYMTCIGVIFNGVTYWCDGCPGPTTHSEPVHRLALRNTVGFDTQARFYRTGAEFYNPRWSPDGTRIAYSTNQNGPGDRDVYVGQVSYNHAPLLHDVTQFHEMDVYAHVPFSYDFSASDSDGEPITFQAVYLPDSATFHATTGLFSWPNPKRRAPTACSSSCFGPSTPRAACTRTSPASACCPRPPAVVAARSWTSAPRTAGSPTTRSSAARARANRGWMPTG